MDLKIIVAVALAFTACLGGPTSALGESCSSTGDCITGKCIDLVCQRGTLECTSDAECVGDKWGGRCNFDCGCFTDSDCSTAKDEGGRSNPYCISTDGGFSICSSVRL